MSGSVLCLIGILKLPLNGEGYDRLIGWGRGRKELLSVSRAVLLESSLDDRRLQPREKKKRRDTLTFYFLILFINSLVASSPPARCNLLTSPQPYSCIWKEPGVSAQRREAELFGRMELIVVYLFWLCYPQVSLGPDRLRSSSAVEFLDIYPNTSRGETTEGGFCTGSELFLQSRGFKSSFGGAPGRGESQRKKFMWPFSL